MGCLDFYINLPVIAAYYTYITYRYSFVIRSSASSDDLALF